MIKWQYTGWDLELKSPFRKNEVNGFLGGRAGLGDGSDGGVWVADESDGC